MKKRKFLAALLAVACATSMAIPAFADDITMAEATVEVDVSDAEQLGNWTMDVENKVQPASLKVTLPSSTTVLVNPYRMEVTIDDDNTSFDTVLSPEMEIINDSDCAIKVGVKGQINTYQIVDTSDTTKWKKMSDLDTVKAVADVDLTVSGLVTETGTAITLNDADDVLTDGKTYAVVSGGVSYAVAAKFTKPTYATKATDTVAVGDCTKNGTLVITGMAASTNIKVATAKMKDPDAEKTNSLYMFVEGSLTSNTYAAFDKASNAGVKDSKTNVMSTVGQVVLSAKEATGTVLYLASSETGYARVSGQAATAPTTPWATLKDKFNTSLTFVIDAVANPAPTAPKATNIALSTVSGFTFDAATTTYTGATKTYSVAQSTIVVTPTVPTGATFKVTATGTAVNTVDDTTDADNPVVALTGAGDAVITVTVSQYGLSTTYTINVTVS